MYKVYIHICPNGKIYIGITMLKLENRWRKGKGYKNSVLFYRAIKKYGWDNIKHEVLFDNITKEDARNKEKELIKELKSNNKKYGYNIEHGGQTGASGLKRSEQTLIKMRNANLGKIISEETKEKIRKTMTGKFVSEETKRKHSISQMGEKNHNYKKKASEETREKMRNNQLKGKNDPHSKKVVQISIDTNEIIKIWGSMGDIRRELGYIHCGISDCCREIQKTAYGFIWQYYKKNNEEEL